MSSKTEYCVSITCTGWANISGYISKDDRDYVNLKLASILIYIYF